MVTVERSVLVGYSAARMYALVEDIRAYPQFLPWCAATEIESHEPGRTTATLHVNYHGIRQNFTTENSNQPHTSITMKLVRGPFHDLDGLWRFTPLGEGACKIEFSLRYRFAGTALEKLIGPVFHHIANTFVDAFVRRAEALYGHA